MLVGWFPLRRLEPKQQLRDRVGRLAASPPVHLEDLDSDDPVDKGEVVRGHLDNSVGVLQLWFQRDCKLKSGVHWWRFESARVEWHRHWLLRVHGCGMVLAKY